MNDELNNNETSIDEQVPNVEETSAQLVAELQKRRDLHQY